MSLIDVDGDTSLRSKYVGYSGVIAVGAMMDLLCVVFG